MAAVFLFDRHGVHQGIDADLLRLLADRFGLRFEVVRTTRWADAMHLIERHEVDLIVGIAYMHRRTTGYNYTVPYLQFPVALVTRADSPFFLSLRDLAGGTLALPAEHVTTLTIRRDHPDLAIQTVQTPAEALRLVSRGGAQATVENLATATHIIKTDGLANLKISGLTDHRFDLRMAVSDERPELFFILEKALRATSAQDLYRLCNRWLSVDYAPASRWARWLPWIVGTAATAGLALLAVLVRHRRLARELGARARMQDELAGANRRLRQLNEEAAFFMGMAAHDLRSPLTSILVAAETLGARSDAVPPEGRMPLRRLADAIMESALRMNRLLQNFLSYHVIEAGETKLNLEPVDLREAAARAVERHAAAAALRRLELVWETPDGPALPVEADRGALDQILDNLLSNALKHSPNGGRVVVRAEERDGWRRFSVRDAGPGVAADDQTRIFDKFVRLSARAPSGEAATGLGLAIVKRFAEEMRGRTGVASTLGHGALFHAEFPPASAPSAAPSESAAR